MARKKRDYPNTSWGREARWEDEENRVNSELRLGGQDAYDSGYAAALELVGKGTSHDEIRQRLLKPPSLTEIPDNFPESLRRNAEVSNRIAQKIADFQQQGVEDALNGIAKRRVNCE